jgi:hypothetical protein
LKVSSATPDLSSSPNPFATMQSHWALKFLKIRPTLKIDIGGKRPTSKRIREIGFQLGGIPIRFELPSARCVLGRDLNFMLAN